MQKPMLGNTSVPGEAEPTTAGEGVAQRISQAILMGMLSVGERLPPEAELAGQFGIAVATLRKALATLRSQGIVETRRGRNGGSFVVQVPFPSGAMLQASLLRTSTIALRDFFDEHAAVGGMAARLAAERLEPGLHTRLAEFAFLAREARTMHDRSMADSRFHFEIAVLSHSQRLLAAEQRLQSEAAPFLWCEDICSASPQFAFTAHLSIAMAIEQRHPNEAQELAIEHIRAAERLIIGGKLTLHRDQLRTRKAGEE